MKRYDIETFAEEEQCREKFPSRWGGILITFLCAAALFAWFWIALAESQP